MLFGTSIFLLLIKRLLEKISPLHIVLQNKKWYLKKCSQQLRQEIRKESLIVEAGFKGKGFHQLIERRSIT